MAISSTRTPPSGLTSCARCGPKPLGRVACGCGVAGWDGRLASEADPWPQPLKPAGNTKCAVQAAADNAVRVRGGSRGGTQRFPCLARHARADPRACDAQAAAAHSRKLGARLGRARAASLQLKGLAAWLRGTSRRAGLRFKLQGRSQAVAFGRVELSQRRCENSHKSSTIPPAGRPGPHGDAGAGQDLPGRPRRCLPRPGCAAGGVTRW